MIRNKPIKVSKQKDRPAKHRTASAEDSLDRWERFWFEPASFVSLRMTRIGLGLLSLIYVSGYLLAAGFWFGQQGLLSTERLGNLVVASEATEAAVWRWSFVYLLDSELGLQLFFGSVALCSLAMVLGWGGRLVALWVWLGIISTANAGWVLAEVGAIPLTLGLSSFVIAGLGRERWGGQEIRESSWNRLGLRLLQIHGIGFLLAYSFSILFNEHSIGEGLQRQLQSSGWIWLPSHFWLCKLIHSALFMVPLLAVPILVFVPAWRTLAVCVVFVHLLIVGCLSGDWYFGWAVGFMALAFIDRVPGPQTGTVPLSIPQPQ